MYHPEVDFMSIFHKHIAFRDHTWMTVLLLSSTHQPTFFWLGVPFESKRKCILKCSRVAFCRIILWWSCILILSVWPPVSACNAFVWSWSDGPSWNPTSHQPVRRAVTRHNMECRLSSTAVCSSADFNSHLFCTRENAKCNGYCQVSIGAWRAFLGIKEQG